MAGDAAQGIVLELERQPNNGKDLSGLVHPSSPPRLPIDATLSPCLHRWSRNISHYEWHGEATTVDKKLGEEDVILSPAMAKEEDMVQDNHEEQHRPPAWQLRHMFWQTAHRGPWGGRVWWWYIGHSWWVHLVRGKSLNFSRKVWQKINCNIRSGKSSNAK